MKGFKNIRAYIYNHGIKTVDVGFENGKITYLGDANIIDEEIPFDNNQILLPGFIDEHIHGAAGYDVMDGNLYSLEKMSQALLSEGVTSFVATTMTAPIFKIETALKNVKDYILNQNESYSEVLGVHLEGPFISEKFSGVQKKEYIIPPSKEVMDKLVSASENTIKIVTIAPEKSGSEEVIKYLKDKGITVSVGHSDADFETLYKSVKIGVSSVTHTYNAQSQFHHREIGIVGGALLLDELYAELIADLNHVSIPAIRLLVKNKPKDKIILITDSMRAKYLKDGIYELGGNEVTVKDGKAVTKSGILSGSVLKMNDAIKNLVDLCGVPFTNAVDFATANPAKNLNVFDKIGSIEIGKQADFVLLSHDFTVSKTIKNGKIVYSK